MTKKDIDEILDVDPEQESIPFRHHLTSYGADYPVDGLVKRLNSKAIVIPSFDPPDEDLDPSVQFQRSFVWTRRQGERFIESLLLGFPVPGIFLVKQNDRKMLVLDGQQRLRTLQNFYAGKWRNRKFNLQSISTKELEGKTYETLSDAEQRVLDDSIIHATIIQQETKEQTSSVFLIFERLNTGGTPLRPQQIRVALFSGPFVQLLRDLNQNEKWRQMIGKQSRYLKDQELILRFFALLDERESYRRPMKDFLNNYMEKNRKPTKKRQGELRQIFVSTVETIHDACGDDAFRYQSVLNAALADSLMVGIAERLRSRRKAPDNKAILRGYRALKKSTRFQKAIRQSTADAEQVSTRLSLSVEKFRGT